MSGPPFAALNGAPLSYMRLVVPALGLWHADVSLASDLVPTAGPQVLTIANSTWACSIVRAIDFAGQRSIRLVAGLGGWRLPVPARQYASPSGVPTVTVLADAAASVGELPPVVSPLVPATLGSYYVRQSGPASLILDELQDRGLLQWWADPTGLVQTMIRPPIPVVDPGFVAEAVNGAAGWYRISTDFPGVWLPGAIFTGVTASGIISRVEHRIDRGHFWTEVLVP